jgi:hypothetical protein
MVSYRVFRILTVLNRSAQKVSPRVEALSIHPSAGKNHLRPAKPFCPNRKRTATVRRRRKGGGDLFLSHVGVYPVRKVTGRAYIT